ncbi:MAG: response regulator [Desulfobacter sp.]|nr:MAG: response regulator [Desulfobacter sp.]
MSPIPTMDKDDPLKDALETIKSSGLKAAAIVDDLLTLSRRGVVTAVPMDIQQIAESYLGSPEHRQFMAAHKSISIRTQFEPCSKTVIGSPVHLSKTLMNLLTNGVEAISGTGEILIRVREQVLSQPQKIIYPVQGYFKIPKGEYILFSISDNGAGIAPEEIEFIFEPFYTSKQMGRSGTGLGMALVMGAVNDHKGFIQVESTLGQGTCVDIYFPAVVQARESGKEVKNRLVKGKNQHLLVVDDDPVQLEIACRLLERLGYRVHCCASGEEGLEFLNRNPVDLVILDIIMEPGMDGVAVCEQILKKPPDQAVLFVTGFSDAATLSRGNCLFKPYSLDRMGAMVEARLRARRPALQ